MALSLAVVFLLMLVGFASSVFGAEYLPEVPWWHVNVGARPTNLPPGGEGTIVVMVTNLGDKETSGEITITNMLPEGIEATEAEYIEGRALTESEIYGSCPVAKVVVCSFGNSVAPYNRIEVQIHVKVGDTAHTGGMVGVSVTGGGAAPVSVSDPLTVSNAPPSFGVETFELTPESADGSVDTQAGSHPFQLTTTTVFNSNAGAALLQRRESSLFEIQPALPKDLHYELPPGLIGNPTPFPQCSEDLFLAEKCPANTSVGVALLRLGYPVYGMTTNPVYILKPAPGEPARFGFLVGLAGVPVYLDTSVRTGSDYGVTVSSDNITELAQLLSAQVTFWGVPGDRRHNRARIEFASTPEVACLNQTGVSASSCPNDTVGAPFLALPTSCGNPSSEPFEASLVGDSWSAPGKPSVSFERKPYVLSDPSDSSIALDGCGKLAFEPSIRDTPDSTAGSSPTGLNVDVHVPQQEVLVPNGDAESTVKDITVALPPGVAVNPSAGDGLQACSLEQIGFTQVNSVSGVDEFTPEEASCPDASKIGTVTIHTPLLANPLRGFVYLAAPQNFVGALENPFGSLLALYVVAKDPVSGVLVKLAGKVSLNESTGQLTTTFEDSPQLPFEDAELEFFGGERAPLASPAQCGSYTTSASFAPWSGNEAVGSSSTFNISSGPNGSPCESPLAFAPTLHSSSANLQAGAFTPLTTTFSREDGQQSLQGLQLHFPAGLSGLLTGVELCPEANANAGTCGANSMIGETIVSVGVGGDPYSVRGGKVYITEKYEGAPFGLSIVNPAKAGPFDLQEGRPVIVRARIEVNPITAALTVTTDNTGPYKIPTMIDGIPLQIKHVNVTVNRPGFTFNPTNCDATRITGAIQSTEGASSNVEVPFQVTDCAALAFDPGFKVSTSGKTSRQNGASLHVELTYPSGAFGKDANIAKVKVDLPKQLPSRLTTLQKACPARTFEANPAGCPTDSIVGHASAITPLIPVALTGPAYFVSYGGAKFPELVIVLQGYGVTLDLHGETFISKAGITSSTFHTVPDAPVGSFELTLPEGSDSALAANGNLCKAKLAMPTAFTAQNGMEIHESTKIGVTGCPKAHKAKKKTKGKKKDKKAKKGK
jgi:hypothetical protein